ncbi:MAG: hypothetical protein RLY14_3226 [Planctomycetota bacterium]|jgi:hypothetical protein
MGKAGVLFEVEHLTAELEFKGRLGCILGTLIVLVNKMGETIRRHCSSTICIPKQPLSPKLFSIAILTQL